MCSLREGQDIQWVSNKTPRSTSNILLTVYHGQRNYGKEDLYVEVHCPPSLPSTLAHCHLNCCLSEWLTFHCKDEVVSGMVKGGLGLAGVHSRVLAMHLHHLQYPHFHLMFAVVFLTTHVVVVFVVIVGNVFCRRNGSY